TDLSDVDKLLNQRLVFSGETNLTLSNDVRTTVAYLHEIERVSFNRGPGECRAHTSATRVFLTPHVNREVSVDRSVLKTLNQVEIRFAAFVDIAPREHFAH